MQYDESCVQKMMKSLRLAANFMSKRSDSEASCDYSNPLAYIRGVLDRLEGFAASLHDPDVVVEDIRRGFYSARRPGSGDRVYFTINERTPTLNDADGRNPSWISYDDLSEFIGVTPGYLRSLINIVSATKAEIVSDYAEREEALRNRFIETLNARANGSPPRTAEEFERDGTIYVGHLASEDWLKIGRTIGKPESRLKDYARQHKLNESMPLLYAFRGYAHESTLHRELGEWRVNTPKGTEFFQNTIECRAALARLVGHLQMEQYYGPSITAA